MVGKKAKGGGKAAPADDFILTIGDEEDVPAEELSDDDPALELVGCNAIAARVAEAIARLDRTRARRPDRSQPAGKKEKRKSKGKEGGAAAGKGKRKAQDGGDEEMDAGFDFNFKEDPVKPWEFSSARRGAIESKVVTSIDDKIRERLTSKAAAPAAKAEAKKRKRGGSEGESEGDDNSESDSDSGDGGEGGEEEDLVTGIASAGEEDEGGEEGGEEEEESDGEGDESSGAEGAGEGPHADELGDMRRTKAQLRKEDARRQASGFFAPEPEQEEGVPVSFSEMHLSRPVLKAIEKQGYSKPTPIQARTIPVALQGRDICGSAVTGSGKTAAFVVPIVERLLHRPKRVAATRVLVLLPTRELAAQCLSVFERFCAFTDIRACLVVGGLSNKVQEANLRARPDIVVATPGRMIDHLRNARSVDLDDVEILVLDEADRLLEMGFTEEVEEVVQSCPKGRQTLLFSATMTEEVGQLIRLSLNQPVRIAVDPAANVARTLSQEFVRVRKSKEGDREAILLALVARTYTSKTIVFCKAKKQAHRLKILFGLAGLKAAELHGNLTQLQRLDALETFRDGKADFLIATDLAARGLDILGVETVINYDMPRTLTQYIHRVGRTARAGTRGRSCSLVGDGHRRLLKDIMENTTRERVKARTVARGPVDEWRGRIEGFEGDVRDILRLEFEEKLLRKAEMEANKAKNLVEHAEEIAARPAKTWFQSPAAKLAAKEAGKAAMFGEGAEDDDAGPSGTEDEGEGGGEGAKKGKKGKKDKKEKKGPEEKKPKRSKTDGLPRKKRRRMALEEEMKKGGGGAPKGETAHAIKSAKKTDRLRRMGELPPERKGKKAKRGSKGGGGGERASSGGGKKGGGLFDSEMRGGGGARGKGGAFKSKKRYKRR
eukprot:tig00000792_g4187.t1